MNDRESLNPLFDIEPLRDHLEAGHTVITSNLRLSRKIRDAWHRDRRAGELQIWNEPAILPLESWLESCWLDLLDAAYPPALAGNALSPHQEALLWQQVIESDKTLPENANPDNFADMARRGWKLVRQWQLEDSHLADSFHEGARFLLKWGKAFEESLAANALISAEMREAIVLQGFAEGALTPLPGICLVGFQTVPPLHRTLLDRATDNLLTHRPDPAGGNQYRVAADDISREISLAARWARARASESPGARIGIVVPKLTALQKPVERVFANTLEPSAILPASGYKPPPFNISAAHPLAEAPVVASALKLLSLLRHELPVRDYGDMLVSPFWGQAEPETEIRCRIQEELLSLGLNRFRPSRFRQLVHSVESDENDAVAENSISHRLSRIGTLQRELASKLSFAEWQDVFTRVLDILGWPGSRSPDSLEYQQLDHWQNLLTTFQALDRVSPPVPVDLALQQLSALAKDTPFHAETPDSQIQILGTLEAAGLAFDHLWVMNMEDRQWPEATSPHPLLPVSLQRALDMPRSSPEKELELSRELFELFAGSAREVVFSHSKREGDIVLNPSVFLEDLPSFEPEAPDAAIPMHPWWPDLQAVAELEMMDDPAGPAYAPPDNKLTGGSGFLSDQAQCPFNAFARRRLGAEALPEPFTGFSPLFRGNLVHKSLEAFWRDVGTSEVLCRLSEDELRARLDDAVQRSLTYLIRSYNGLITEEDFGRRLLELEKQRLVRLLGNWLQLEMERAPFQVAHTELNAKVTLGDYWLSLRLDRVDRLDSGQLAIIDYKTGQAGIGGNLQSGTGNRLLETQLPLYALALQAETGEMPAAVSYGKINARETGFDGLAEDGDLIRGCQPLAKKGLPETWEETLQQWQAGLESLVAEIARGEAEVVFYSNEAARYGADLEPLNRWPDLERLSGVREHTGKGDRS